MSGHPVVESSVGHLLPTWGHGGDGAACLEPASRGEKLMGIPEPLLPAMAAGEHAEWTWEEALKAVGS